MKRVTILLILSLGMGLSVCCNKSDNPASVNNPPAAPRVRVLAIEPQPVERDDTLLVYGAGFNKDPWRNRVLINNIAATPKAASDSVLVVVVPDDAVSGFLRVAVQGDTTDPVPISISPVAFSLSRFRHVSVNALFSLGFGTAYTFSGAPTIMGNTAQWTNGASTVKLVFDDIEHPSSIAVNGTIETYRDNGNYGICPDVDKFVFSADELDLSANEYPYTFLRKNWMSWFGSVFYTWTTYELNCPGRNSGSDPGSLLEISVTLSK